jgi:hypothetical protein
LITIRVGLYEGRGGHRGMPTIISVLSSAIPAAQGARRFG